METLEAFKGPEKTLLNKPHWTKVESTLTMTKIFILMTAIKIALNKAGYKSMVAFVS